MQGRHGSVQLSVELKKDALLWNELRENKMKMVSCKVLAPGAVAVVTTGSQLEFTVYEPGAVLVINKDDWETE